MSTSSSEGGAAGTGTYVPPSGRGRLIAIVVGLLVITNVVTGLAVFYLATPAPPSATVTVIGPWAGSEWAAFKPVMDAFTNATGIPYQYTTSRQEDLQLTAPITLQAGQSPGDVVFMPSSYIKQWAKKGWVADLTSTLPASNYQPGALSPLTVNGTVWGGAFTGKVKPGFWYRQSFFTAHSLQVPTTWAQFQALLWTIKNITGVSNPIISGDGVGWPLTDVTEHFIATYGGAGMHQNLTARTLKWTDSSVESVFSTYLVPLLSAGLFSQPITWDNPGVSEFWNGTYPLYFMGSWITGMVPNPSDLGVFGLPGGVTNQGIVFAADYFFVPQHAAHPDLAKRLAGFLGSKDAQTVQVKQGGHIATAAGVPLSAYPTVDAKVASLLTGKTVLPDLDDTIGGTFQPAFWKDLQAMWATPANWQTILGQIQAAAQASP